MRSLSLSGATLKQSADPTKGFDPGVTEYTASVISTVAYVTVRAEPHVSGATISWPPDEDTGRGGVQVELNPPDQTTEITVTVTATDEQTEKTYTIIVTRAASPTTDNRSRPVPDGGDARPSL